MISTELKQAVINALKTGRENFGTSDAKYATSLGINSAQYSRIKNGDTDRVLSQAQWITLARRLGVSLSGAPNWQYAETPVWQVITAQLEYCRTLSRSAVLCDMAGVGKTCTARRYAETHRHTVYIDCSLAKTRSKMIRNIAKSYGLGNTGLYSDVFEDLVFYLKTLPNPLIIFDEAGDLEYEAFLEIKALWNATEHTCGFYMMGADGLKQKIQRCLDIKKVGYAEIFSRFGGKYTRVTPGEKQECIRMLMRTGAEIIRANMQLYHANHPADLNPDINKILRQSLGDDDIPSIRRIHAIINTAELTTNH
jgi:DNA transposition AAA+ family ATPase